VFGVQGVVVDVLAEKKLVGLRASVLAMAIVISPAVLSIPSSSIQFSLSRASSIQSSPAHSIPSLHHATPIPNVRPRHRHRKQSSAPQQH
jgi:hypothetical protein